MEKKFYPYPSIEQFRHVVKKVVYKASHEWDDQLEDMVVVNDYTPPKITFMGTPKIHGTNAAVVVTDDGEVYAQSRKRIITPEDDNFGFAKWVDNDDVKRFFIDLKELNGYTADKSVFYGEWFGGSIQKGVAVSQLEEKHFAVFEMMNVFESTDINTNEVAEYHSWTVPVFPNVPELNIITPASTQTYFIPIDFGKPEETINMLIELTEEVEKQCPVGRYFGLEGVGEGIVWRYQDQDGCTFRFKVKGEEHSSSKVKKLASVDVEKLESVKQFVDYAVTENRLQQMADETLMVDGELDFDRRNLGKFIKAVSADVYKEEYDALEAADLTMKDVGNKLSKVARDWFFAKESY